MFLADRFYEDHSIRGGFSCSSDQSHGRRREEPRILIDNALPSISTGSINRDQRAGGLYPTRRSAFSTERSREARSFSGKRTRTRTPKRSGTRVRAPGQRAVCGLDEEIGAKLDKRRELRNRSIHATPSYAYRARSSGAITVQTDILLPTPASRP